MSLTGWLETMRAAVLAGPGSGSTLLVAVSGGSDSVALLHGLMLLQDSLRLRLVVAHLDHALRPDSAEDAAFVGRMALDLRLLCLRERRAVAELVAESGGNLEEVARCVRYGVLDSAARAVGADAIALAHTADDQAETLLMNLLRGAGLDGLKGMLPLAPPPFPELTTPLFRPLLMVPRTTLRDWLDARGQPWREDVTNQDRRFRRSRLRYEVIPFLEQLQPTLRSRLARTAHTLALDHAWLAAETERVWQQLTQLHPARVGFSRSAFLAQPPALQRRLLRRAFAHLCAPPRDLSHEQTSHALTVAAQGTSGSRATLPGHLSLLVEYDMLWVEGEADSEPEPIAPLVLPSAGTVAHGTLTVTVEMGGREMLPADWRSLPRTTALLDGDTLRWPLTLRPPTPDESWQPLGMATPVHLRSWLATHHVPRHERSRLLVLTDATNTILWLVGWGVSEAARVQPTSEQVVRIAVVRSSQ